ncbi:MAG TPA: hypothetical protein PLU38_08670 [Kiritimatiellia bacterium]|nr:MAG: hypothetical protein BWX70_01452 [Verrucomicrobia bacterium ADurb.Bin070]HPB11180.1 hypothetical protein [Kiritimatiellia bacterium]HPO37534.1 hypothetical protein [Kiritimatiellia bacterium]HQA38609.1 hypothetical protein [Kiritimatiellia bacterium]HQL51551.1 hypothetical protein [Kiritimatiellia bacterium]
MTTRRLFVRTVMTGAAVSLLAAVQSGCQPAAEPARPAAPAGAGIPKLKAAGAVVIAADSQKVTIKIRCQKCGFLSEEIQIDTPKAGQPYTQAWTCPKCGHKQTVTIELDA